MGAPRFLPPPTRYAPHSLLQPKPAVEQGAPRAMPPPVVFASPRLLQTKQTVPPGSAVLSHSSVRGGGTPPPPTKYGGTSTQAKNALPHSSVGGGGTPPPTKYGPAFIQTKIALPVVSPLVAPPPFRASAVQRAALKADVEDVDELTDDDETTVDQEWVHFQERPKMPTLYSFALAQGGNPVVNEGPHTVANVVYRAVFEDFVARDDRAGLKAYFAKMPTPDQFKKILQDEGVSEENLAKLGKCISEYSNGHAKVAGEIDTASIKDLALAIWRLANLHPYATYGWKGALRGKKVSARSSKGKGEKIKVRLKKKIKSVTRSSALVDRGGKFVDQDGYEVYKLDKLAAMYFSKKKAKRYVVRDDD